MNTNTLTPPPPQIWGSPKNRLIATLATALVVAGSFATPAMAQTVHACQEQYDQSCVHTGWGYGRGVTCVPRSRDSEGGTERCWTGSGTPTSSSRAHGPGLSPGPGWFSPNRHYNSWNFYPMYVDPAGRIYVQARCRTGNMGTSYVWGKHPHSSPPPNWTLPKNVTCPP